MAWPRLLLALSAGLLLACGAATLIPERPEERSHGIAVQRSLNLRSAALTYRLGAVERDEQDGVRVDFTLQNGSSRDIEQGLLRVILYGTDGRLISARLPFAGLPRARSRFMSARFGAVPFRVQDFGLEVIFVVP
ncbi:MAG: hypothetical protein CL910_01540 [Deltaproteobacteria bacterium]|nr:hypothetical protein [Deltaproteobacteria bacterium]